MSNLGPGLNPKDEGELKAGRIRVMKLMSDFEWHDAVEIRNVAGVPGCPASDGTRRLRELRDREHGGWTIEKRRYGGKGRLYEYRMVQKPNGEIPFAVQA